MTKIQVTEIEKKKYSINSRTINTDDYSSNRNAVNKGYECNMKKNIPITIGFHSELCVTTQATRMHDFYDSNRMCIKN